MFFDVAGALFSLLSTYYFIRMNNKAWPIGLIATCLNSWLYWQSGIYADMFLELFYFVTIGYGWYNWHQAKLTKTDTTLGFLSKQQWIFLYLTFILTFILIHYLLASKTHSNVAFLDALTTSLSLVAQWLMCHKIIVTWVLWFITDAIYAFMYFSKNLPMHGILMILYTGMAIAGYLTWIRLYQKVDKDRVRDVVAIQP